jgi:hypothetical protein
MAAIPQPESRIEPRTPALVGLGLLRFGDRQRTMPHSQRITILGASPTPRARTQTADGSFSWPFQTGVITWVGPLKLFSAAAQLGQVMTWLGYHRTAAQSERAISRLEASEELAARGNSGGGLTSHKRLGDNRTVENTNAQET